MFENILSLHLHFTDTYSDEKDSLWLMNFALHLLIANFKLQARKKEKQRE
jgi:hypothetical protein